MTSTTELIDNPPPKNYSTAASHTTRLVLPRRRLCLSRRSSAHDSHTFARRRRRKPEEERHVPSIRCTPKRPKTFHERGSHTSPGKRTVTARASAGVSASVRDSCPGPVEFKTKKYRLDR